MQRRPSAHDARGGRRDRDTSCCHDSVDTMPSRMPPKRGCPTSRSHAASVVVASAANWAASAGRRSRRWRWSSWSPSSSRSWCRLSLAVIVVPRARRGVSDSADRNHESAVESTASASLSVARNVSQDADSDEFNNGIESEGNHINFRFFRFFHVRCRLRDGEADRPRRTLLHTRRTGCCSRAVTRRCAGPLSGSAVVMW